LAICGKMAQIFFPLAISSPSAIGSNLLYLSALRNLGRNFTLSLFAVSYINHHRRE
jgi:hypothetical protein